MNTKLLAVTALAGACLGTVFGAAAESMGAQIVTLESPVMVNQTGAYVEAQTNMAVYPGDRLMAMGGGAATIRYANGCEQSLGDNEIAQVGTAESCSSALAAAGTHHAVGEEPAAGGASAGAAAGPNVFVLGTFAAYAGFIGYEASEGSSGNGSIIPPISP